MTTPAPGEPAALTTGTINVIRRKTLNRAVRGTIVGNVMEWYDVGVFGYLIVTLGAVFLPEADPAAQVVFLLGTFASTYLLRPVGGLFFGWLGDKIGRRRVLLLTLILVAVSTFCIGILPTYDAIGFSAALLLMFLKVVQGFSAGGELTGALTFIGESAPDKKRGFYCALLDSGSYMGFALGAAFVTLLQVTLGQDTMVEWAWRIPFLVAGPLGIIAIVLRLRVEESPHFAALQVEQLAKAGQTALKVSIFRVFAQNWRPMLIVALLVAAANTAGYAFTSYMPTYLATVENYDAVQSNLLTLPLLVLMALAMPFVGALSDKVGRKPVLFAASVITIVLSVPAFLLIDAGTPALVVAGLALMGFPVALYMGSLAATYPALFPTKSRYTSLGASYNISVAVFGGTAPLVIDSLIHSTGTFLAAPLFLIGASVVGLVTVFFLKESARRPLDGAEPNVETDEEAHEIHTARIAALAARD